MSEGYSDNPSQVRVDYFKETNKWYCAEAMNWILYDTAVGEQTLLIHDVFALSLVYHLNEIEVIDFRVWKPTLPPLSLIQTCRLYEMTAVCLSPYHEHSHPLMMTVRQAIVRADNLRAKLGA